MLLNGLDDLVSYNENLLSKVMGNIWHRAGKPLGSDVLDNKSQWHYFRYTSYHIAWEDSYPLVACVPYCRFKKKKSLL